MAKRHSAFTLIEILIVVIILGILAAIVIPQFTNASDDAKLSSLQSTVQSVRSQCELYKLQAGGSVPTSSAFWTTLGASTVFDNKTVGPWIQAAPINPFNQSTAVGDALSGSNGWAIVGGKFYGNARGTWLPKEGQ